MTEIAVQTKVVFESWYMHVRTPTTASSTDIAYMDYSDLTETLFEGLEIKSSTIAFTPDASEDVMHLSVTVADKSFETKYPCPRGKNVAPVNAFRFVRDMLEALQISANVYQLPVCACHGPCGCG